MKRLLCALLAAVLLTGAALAGEIDPQGQGIGLEGVGNARELGGYVAGDGRTVRRGVFLRTAEAGENVTVKRGGFILENAGNITEKEIGTTAYSVASNAWTVTKTSGTKSVGKIADVRDDGVVVIVGR